MVMTLNRDGCQGTLKQYVVVLLQVPKVTQTASRQEIYVMQVRCVTAVLIRSIQIVKSLDVSGLPPQEVLTTHKECQSGGCSVKCHDAAPHFMVQESTLD
jgi:hypothetical protein